MLKNDVVRFQESRREFLERLAAGGVMVAAGAVPGLAAEPDPHIKDIVASTITVDMHNHGVIGSAPTPVAANTSGNARPSGRVALQRDPDAAIAMRRAGYSAICLAYAPDGRLMQVGAGDAAPGTRSNLIRDPKPGEMYQAHSDYLDQMDAALTTLKLARALTYADLEAAHKQRQPIVIQDAEGADFLEKGHLDRLEEAYKRGIRKLQLVHYAVNDIGDYQIGPAVHRGLSDFGADAVKECHRLGIIVDTAHCTFDTVEGVVKASSKPILLSHTAVAGSKAQGSFWADNFRGGLPTMQARQVTPEHARAVAGTGGVVGIWHLFSSVEKYVQGVREMVDIIGADHVGIGMDWPTEGINFIWPGQSVGAMFAVIGEMRRQGFSKEDCSKIAGGNFCRVFRAHA
jgi:membrane dipeptidase